jgi:Alkaline phosphatase PhoX
MRKRILWMLPVGALAATATAVALAAAGAETGPSSSQSPYLVRSQPGVVTKSIITVGDAAPNGYRMVGIPDGLGAFDNGDGTFTVLMNHELSATQGIPRAHGSAGALVSKWIVDKDDLSIVSGQDLIRTVHLWQNGAYVTGTTAFDRFCSANLANLAGERVFMNGEEAGTEGRAFAHLLDGSSWQLPALGRMSYENAVANPDTAKTVVGELDDATGGQVYFYYGDKQATGSTIERAGLANGSLYGLKINGVASESDATVVDTTFTLAPLGNVTAKTGAQLEADSNAAGVSRLLRPEDGAWDPTDPSVFYFVTTNAFDKPSKLWRLHFADPENPAAGGTVETVLAGPEGGHQMFDNITVNDRGQVLIQEDPGNQPYLARVWLYDYASDSLTEIAKHDPDRFAVGGSAFLTQDEESSGIIPAPFLGEGKYLADVQAHYPIAGELVQGGQLLVVQVPPGKFPQK